MRYQILELTQCNFYRPRMFMQVVAIIFDYVQQSEMGAKLASQGHCVRRSLRDMRLEIGRVKNAAKLNLDRWKSVVVSRLQHCFCCGDLGPDGKNWAARLSENLFRHGTHQQLAETSASMGAEHKQVNFVDPDDVGQHLGNFPVPYISSVGKSSEAIG